MTVQLERMKWTLRIVFLTFVAVTVVLGVSQANALDYGANSTGGMNSAQLAIGEGELDEEVHADSNNYSNDGWINLGAGAKGYAKDGNLITGWADILVSGKTMRYYFESGTGALVQNAWLQIDGAIRYFRPSGNMAIGWAEIDGSHYFFRSSGDMVTGFSDVPDDAYKRYFDEAGRMITGWCEINGEVYFFRKSGAMQTGQATIDGVDYTFTDKGVLVSDGLSSTPMEDVGFPIAEMSVDERTESYGGDVPNGATISG